jgi:peroxiredoxin
MRMVRFAWFFAILILVSSCNSDLSSSPYKDNLLVPYDFKLENIYEEEVSLGSYLGKKAVIIVFWATWCPYCRSALVDLKGKREYLNNEGIEVLAVNVGESLQKVKSFVAGVGLDFVVLLDRDLMVSDTYGILGVPTFIAISKSGKVVYSGNRFYKEKLKDLNLE